jgi:hypothetical protein
VETIERVERDIERVERKIDWIQKLLLIVTVFTAGTVFGIVLAIVLLGLRVALEHLG